MGEQDWITRLEAEREELVLPAFNEDIAWAIGVKLRERAAAEGLPIAFEVARPGGRLFFASMPGASPDNAGWIRRKRNVVERFWESSLLMTLRCEKDGTTVTRKFELSEADFVHSGGGVAVRTADSGFVGSVIVSGLTQYEDHTLAVWAIGEVLQDLRK